MVAPIVRFYMLTEDSGSYAHATWTALLRRMCRLVDESCQTQDEVFAVEEPEEEVQKTMAANQWRSRRALDHARRVHFWKTIADQLEDAKVVAFHVDGDVPWSRRAQSQNVRDVQEIALPKLRNTLEDRQRRPEEIKARLACFLPLHPFRQIEAWLFHNLAVIERLCESRAVATPACVEVWRANPEALEEEDKLKIKVPFGSAHNRDLAQEGFPAKSVDALGSSFRTAVETLRSCAPLRDALSRTYAVDRWRGDG